jgi:hypothetical protein
MRPAQGSNKRASGTRNIYVRREKVMENKEKILLGIRHCVYLEECEGCPYDNDGYLSKCIDNLLKDAEKVIKEEE